MKKKTYLLPAIALLFVMVLAVVHADAVIVKDEEKKVITEKAFKIRVPFIANEGQIKNSDIRFYVNTFGGTVFVTKSGQIVYSLLKFGQKTGEEIKDKRIDDKRIEQKPVKSIALKEEFAGENIKAEVNGEERAITKVSYFKGNDPSRWKKDIPTYNLISLGEVYRGIELKLRASGKSVEKLFYVSPGAEPEDIKVEVKGSKILKVNGKGELEVETEFGPVKFTKPVAYQEIDGKRVEVAVNYSILNSKPQTSNTKPTYGFKVGDYEKTKELVIDPLLSSTFLGGSSDDYVSSIAIGSGGDIYVAGKTFGGLPITPGAYDISYNGGYGDAFVSRLSADLTTLLSSTFLGGISDDDANSITIDSGGDIYVAGHTFSSDFPTTPGAYDTSYNGGLDAFVSRLSADLTTLLSSTFLGSTSEARTIAIGSEGDIYVAGSAQSDFPTTPGAYDTSYNGGNYDAFVSRLSADLTTLLSSTFLGGISQDDANSIAIGSGGEIYIAGDTGGSSDFPTTPGAYDTSHNGGGEAFVSRFSADLTTLLSSTFLGGTDGDDANSIAIGSEGDIYVAGDTYSYDFPTTPGAYDTSYNGGFDAFISRLSGDLTSLLSSTFLGGAGYEYANSIAIGSGGDIYVAGDTYSSDFPTTPDAYDTSHNGGWDAFVSRFSADLTSLLSSTFLGGTYGFSGDSADSITIDSDGNIYVAGTTDSYDFPTTPDAYDTSYNGGRDAFVSRLDSSLLAPCTIGYSPTSFIFTATQGGSNPPDQTLSISNTGGGTLDWSVSDNATWLSLSPTSGTNTGNVTLSIDVSGLTAGTYNAIITITATGAANSPVNIPVTLTINPPPTIGYSPTSFSFTATQGGSNPPNQTLSISNTGSGTLDWSVTDNATPWLGLSPTSGTDSGTVTVSVNIAGLTAGTYNATITITAPNAANTPVNIPVTLTVNPPLPTIGYSPISFIFTATQGRSNPPNQTLSISNTGVGTLTWSVTDNATWLSLSPTSGTDSGTVTLSVNITGLTAGTYNATITITAVAAINSPVDIPVTLIINVPTSASHWIKAYGGNIWDEVFSTNSVHQTSPDGEYIVAGNTGSFGTGSSDFWMLKLDTNGNVLWQKTYGESLYDYAESIQRTFHGGYVVAGWTNSFGAGNYDFLVLRLDSSGNVLWQNTYGGSGNDYAYSIQQTSDLGYIVAGDTESFGAGGIDAWILKLDANGNVLWQKTYGGIFTDHAESIQQTTDGGYIVFGITASFGTGNGDFWVLKLDASGNVLWQKTYGGSSFNVARSIQQTSDNGYIIAGMTQSFGAGSGDAWVLKLDINGNVQWQKTYGGSDFDGAAIQQTSDGGYIMVGRTASFGAGSDDVWVLKLDTTGNVQWQKTYGGSDSEITPTIRQTSDGGYIAAGVTYSFGAGNRDVLVLKLDSNGDIPGCSIAGTSNAEVTNSSATITNTSVTGINTTVSPQTSAVTVVNTNATVTDVCFSSGPEVLTLFSPNGGEIIPSGSPYTIQWGAPTEAVRYDIGYSLDDGASGTWKLIASNITDYSYNWTVPVPDGNKNTCRVGVRGYNASGGVVGTDTSDNPFKIEVVKLTYPNGGETLISGNTYQITWQTNSTIRPVQSVQIYGSPNEGKPGTWRLLTTVYGNPGFYDWTVPIVGIAQDKCRLGLRLLDSASTPIGQDVGDGNFTVQPAP